jgi:hypothetical protein
MKKICALFVSLVFVLGLVVSPTFAGGDKVQGDNAVSDSFGGETGNGETPGNDAMGNQV